MDGSAGDAEQPREVGLDVSTCSVPGSQVPALGAGELGCLPRIRSFARATAVPSRVRMRIRPATNSATMLSTLNNRRPTGSVGPSTTTRLRA